MNYERFKTAKVGTVSAIIHQCLGRQFKVEVTSGDAIGRELAKAINATSEHSLHHDLDGASDLWPVIRRLNIRVNSPVLATGAVLQDLPGTDDAVLARSDFSETAMKLCQKIFITNEVPRVASSLASTRTWNLLVLNPSLGLIWLCITRTIRPEFAPTIS